MKINFILKSFLVLFLVSVTVLSCVLYKTASAAVLYENPYVGLSYDITQNQGAGYGFYTRFPQWSGSGSLFPGGGQTISGTATKLRVKRLSGVACNYATMYTNVYGTDGSTLIGYSNNGAGTANGDYCDFPLLGGTANAAPGYVAICIWGACNGTYGTLNLDGSLSNAGYVVDGSQTKYQKGGWAFQLCDNGGCSGGFIPPSNYYAKIKNTTGGSMNFRDAANTSSNIIKTLPEDWILSVASTTNGGSPVTSNGYNWYQVTDPTDGVTGWMAGSDASSTVYYLPYDTHQTVFQATSTDQIATSSRPAVILDAIDHYYNDTSTSTSLFSSDDGPTGYKISQLKNGGYPVELIWGIAGVEDGGTTFGFNNENVSYDYGHGIMQITFSPSYPFDNRGIASNVTIPPCALGSSLYLNCYTSVNGTDPLYYKPYGGSGDTYKQYTNTSQSMYANIKDGLYILAHNYDVFDYINTSTTTGGVTYSADDRKNILTTLYYNGDDDACTSYIGAVANRLDHIDATGYFPTATTTGISALITKMHSAATNVSCAYLHSPGDLSIQDSTGRTIGIVDGKGRNDFPLALYDKTRKFAAILAAENTNDYTYKVVGTGSGTYGLDISIKNGDQKITFKATDIAMLPNEVHSYILNKDELLKGQGGVTVKIDRNGDGIVDRTIKTNTTLTGDVYNTEATPEELQAFKLGDVNTGVLPQRDPIVPEGSPYSKFSPESSSQTREADKELPAFMKDRPNSGNILNKKDE